MSKDGVIKPATGMPAVSLEVARQDIERWLAHRRIPKIQLEKDQDTIDQLVSYVQEGILVIKDDCSVTQKLQWEILRESDTIVEFSYKPRVMSWELSQNLKNVKLQDLEGRYNAFAAALSGREPNTFTRMDSVDRTVMHVIVGFYM